MGVCFHCGNHAQPIMTSSPCFRCRFPTELGNFCMVMTIESWLMLAIFMVFFNLFQLGRFTIRGNFPSQIRGAQNGMQVTILDS